MNQGKEKGKTSVRRRVYLVVAFIALSPLMILFLSVPYEAVVKQRLVNELGRVSEEVSGEPKTSDELAAILEEHNVWGRLLEGDADATFQFQGPTPTNLVGVFEDTRENIVLWDKNQPPLAERPESKGSVNTVDAYCVVGGGEQLLLCSRVTTVVVADEERALHLLTANVRNVRALSFVGILQLSMEMLILALLIGFWLTRRVMVPIESLHAQVVSARSSSSKRPEIAVDDDSEIGALGVEFERLLNQLEERNDRTEAFASDLAHELKNPLAAISSCADNLGSGLTEPEHVERYVGVLDRSTDRLRLMVDDFLRLARAESGLKHSSKQTVELGSLVARICDDLRSDHDLSETFFELETTPAHVFVSEDDVKTALHNVIENAVQVGTDRMQIRIRVIDDVARLDIRDFGPGFGNSDPNDVFERFFSRREGGTGLGLAISRAIVVAEHGTIDAIATENGSLFRISLPIVTR